MLLLVGTISIQYTTAQSSNETIRNNKGSVRSNGISIAFESFGSEENESILLIQGIGAQMILWPEELCRQLALKGYRVIRFDNRDVGMSSKLDHLGMPDWSNIIPLIGSCDESKLPYTLADMSKDAVGLLDALRIKKAHIVGASMGGAIAQLIAIHYPERTLSLTSIMASSGNHKAPSGDPDVLRIMGTPPPETNDVDSLSKYLSNVYKAIGSPGYPTTDSTLLQIAKRSIQRSWYPLGSARQAAAVIIGDNCDRREQLKSVKVPTVVLHGEDDPVVNIEAGREVALAIPHAIFIPVPGMGHDMPAALVPQFREAILRAAKR